MHRDELTDPEIDRLMARVRPAWDDARTERNLAVVVARLHGRRPRRRLPALFARLRLSRAAR